MAMVEARMGWAPLALAVEGWKQGLGRKREPSFLGGSSEDSLWGLRSSGREVSPEMDAPVDQGGRAAWELAGFVPPCIAPSEDTCNLPGLCPALR